MKHNLKDFRFEKLKADIVLSLGSSCRVAHHLRKNHLRLFASPLDWMLGTNLKIALELFKTDFKEFFTHCSAVKAIKKTLEVRDDKTGLISIHHFFANENLNIQSKRINAQSVKRWKLIKEKLKNSKNIILIFNDKASLEELKFFLENFCAFDYIDDTGGGGGIVLICVSNDESLKGYEIRMQEYQISANKKIFEYFINESSNDFRGNEIFWTKLMKSIKMPLKIKLKNVFNEFKINFLRSCKKRIAFFTKKYKNNINKIH